MESEDGSLFIKNLAYFVRTHERALANIQLTRQTPKNASAATNPTGRAPAGSDTASPSYGSTALAAALSFPYLSFTSTDVKPANLTLTPHHLYYLLSRFEELGVPVGPMNVRLENIHSGSPSTTSTGYVSFLAQTKGQKGRSSDRDSIHSVSSVQSVLSMSSLWSSLGLSSASAARSEKQKSAVLEDLRYLYSAFTKIPCLQLAYDRKSRPIKGFEEFPLDTAVPAFVFKNLSALEICDVDFRQVFGWDCLAEQLRSLTLKRATLHDLSELLTNIVLDDMDRRRQRSGNGPPSPTMTWIAPNPVSSPATGEHPGTISPLPPSNSRHGSADSYGRSGGLKVRRSSTSSGSSLPSDTSRKSSPNSAQLGALPTAKWRFLKHLSLADNGLTYISATSLVPLANTLQSLDLSANLFVEIPDSLASLTALRALNLENCMIESLHSLTRNPLPAISTLNLRANRLVSLAGVERLLSLERLDLRENKLSDPTELARLTGIPELQEIYVNRNPFVKTHIQYRITIFNLFRRTPGYTQDIILDSAGPTYAERRQLIDRVGETVNPPIVKLAAEEEPVTPLKGPSVVRQKLAQDEKARDSELQSAPETPGTEYSVGSQRRRKGPRRRIVELSNGNQASPYFSQHSETAAPTLDIPITPGRNMTSGRSGNVTALTVGSATQRQNQDRMPFDDTAATSLQDVRRPDDHLKGLPRPAGMDAEAYRKRMEALRNDVGSGWLSALNDGAWDDSKDGHKALHYEKDTNAPGEVRPGHHKMNGPGQGIVSGGRTLG